MTFDVSPLARARSADPLGNRRGHVNVTALTEAEAKILAAVREHKTYAKAANVLGLKPKTVSGRMETIREKLAIEGVEL